MKNKDTPPIVRRGMIQLEELRHKVIHDLLVQCMGFLFFLKTISTNVYNQFSILYRGLKTRFMFFTNLTFHNLSSPFFIKVLFRSRNQSKPSHLLSHAILLRYSMSLQNLKRGFFSLRNMSQNLVKSVSCLDDYIKLDQHGFLNNQKIIIGYI